MGNSAVRTGVNRCKHAHGSHACYTMTSWLVGRGSGCSYPLFISHSFPLSGGLLRFFLAQRSAAHLPHCHTRLLSGPPAPEIPPSLR